MNSYYRDHPYIAITFFSKKISEGSGPVLGVEEAHEAGCPVHSYLATSCHRTCRRGIYYAAPPLRHFVVKVFTGVLLAEKGGLPHYPNAGLLARERVFKVSDGSEEAGIIIAVVEAGAGITEATALVNEHRASRAPFVVFEVPPPSPPSPSRSASSSIQPASIILIPKV